MTRYAEPAVVRRTFLERSLPWMWLTLSAAWAASLFITEAPAWPVALWVATTIGPLTLLRIHVAPQLTLGRS